MPTLEQILSDPGYQALKPEERTGIRRSFYQQTAKDPGFRSLAPEERQTISRDILFPASEYPEEAREGRPKLTVGEVFSSGLERIITPPKTTAELAMGPGRTVLGAAEMIGAPLQPAANLATRAGERVSDYLTGKGYGRLSDVAAGLTTGVGDYATGIGLAKGLNLLKAPIAKALPTIKEKVGALTTKKASKLAANETLADQATLASAERAKRLAGVRGTERAALPIEQESRLADVERLANEAQARTAASQAGRLQEIPVRKAAIQGQATQDIEAVEQQLAGQQAGVGLEAAKAGAPVGPKRMNFERRYTALEQTADQIPIKPVNLNVKAHALIREPGIPGTPTLPSERSSAAISRTLTEADPEEIGNQVQRMLTAGAEAKAPDYKAITRTVLGPATADGVTVGELLRARKRLREAERVAYKAEHKNLARQWGELEDAITEDIKELAKTDKTAATIYRQSRNLDKDYFKKKATDWYAEGVDQAFDPAKGAWDRKRFTKWWEKHADSTNNDRDLRRLLGDRYEGTKGLVDDMQKATELKIEQAAKEAVRNIRRRMGTGLREAGTREKQIGEFGKEIEKQIGEARKEGVGAVEKEFLKKEGQLAKSEKVQERYQKFTDRQITAQRKGAAEAIEKDIEGQIEKITGKPYMGQFSKAFGGLQLLSGLGGMAWGTVTANPTLIGGGAAATGAGLWTVMSHEAFIKLVNAPRGLSIARRLVRAAPGTGEAIAASSAAARVLQGLEGKEGEGEIDIRPSGAKESLLRKYGIQ